MSVKKAIYLILFLFLFFLGVFYSVPFYYVKTKKIDFSIIVLSSIAYKETKNATTQEEKAISIYNYIRKNIQQPGYSKVYYSNVLGQSCKYLIARKAYCDNQCNELLEIAYYANLYGRLVFLHGQDSISKHSVCELQVNRKFVMLDPYYGIILRNRNNNIIGIKEILENKALIPDSIFTEKTPKKNYIRLFAVRFPYKVIKYNKPHKTNQEMNLISNYKYWYAIFGEANRKHLFAYYYKLNRVVKEDQRRINLLFQ